MLKALQTSFKSFTTAILCQKSRNRDTISARTQRRRRSGKYSGEELCCAPVGHTQRAAQDASEARQATKSKSQTTGARQQTAKQQTAKKRAALEATHEYRPAAARIGSAQSKTKTKPHLPFSPKPARPLRPPWPESALRAGPYRPALIRGSQ